jgi:hypothetical protein
MSARLRMHLHIERILSDLRNCPVSISRSICFAALSHLAREKAVENGMLNPCSQGDGVTLAGVVDNDEPISYCETALSGFAGKQVNEILGCNG